MQRYRQGKCILVTWETKSKWRPCAAELRKDESPKIARKNPWKENLRWATTLPGGNCLPVEQLPYEEVASASLEAFKLWINPSSYSQNG